MRFLPFLFSCFVLANIVACQSFNSHEHDNGFQLKLNDSVLVDTTIQRINPSLSSFELLNDTQLVVWDKTKSTIKLISLNTGREASTYIPHFDYLETYKRFISNDPDKVKEAAFYRKDIPTQIIKEVEIAGISCQDNSVYAVIWFRYPSIKELIVGVDTTIFIQSYHFIQKLNTELETLDLYYLDHTSHQGYIPSSQFSFHVLNDSSYLINLNKTQNLREAESNHKLSLRNYFYLAEYHLLKEKNQLGIHKLLPYQLPSFFVDQKTYYQHNTNHFLRYHNEVYNYFKIHPQFTRLSDSTFYFYPDSNYQSSYLPKSAGEVELGHLDFFIFDVCVLADGSVGFVVSKKDQVYFEVFDRLFTSRPSYRQKVSGKYYNKDNKRFKLSRNHLFVLNYDREQLKVYKFDIFK